MKIGEIRGRENGQRERRTRCGAAPQAVGENRGTPYQTTPTQRRFTGQVLDNVASGTVGFNYCVV
ncbi:MAG: hypothetical protein WBD79_20560 [Anaerolineae bacterium]|uniref:hypothetical protein n=1 Tax=Candidatus Amarolinea dominans TaxID=3140696 RepID=UPI0031372947|nr:hypothetical protein [Anaerolineae bacterium]